MALQKDELSVITKMYDLVLWYVNHTIKFPRSHRFVLGERIERGLYDLLDILIEAKYSKEKPDLLKQANLSLEKLRFQTRLAKDTRCLSVGSYEYGIKQMQGIGREIGVWERAARGGK